MSVEEWALVASVVFAGLWSGLLAILTTIIHPMLKQGDGREFTEFLRAFLPAARTAPFNYIEVAGLVLAPLVALVALIAGDGGTALVLTAVGFALTVAGPLLTSNRLAEPNYDVILDWKPEQLPADWEEAQRRYYLYNWVRAAATWVAFGLFFAALLVLD